ncbi:hypothetical protein BH11MYX2_BH11MYX2_20030 [soil metagenome]
MQAVLADPSTAPISDKLKATLPFLRKVTRDHQNVTAADARALLDAGVTKAQVQDALMVCWCFNTITRLADTFEFEVGPQAAFDSSANMLLKRGYKL